MKNYYDILQVPPDADGHQIRQAYRQLSMQFHPDRHGGSRYFEEKFKQINEAYEVLRDPVRRWQYGQQRQRPSAGPRPCGDWARSDRTAQSGAGARRRPAGASFRTAFEPYRRRKSDLGNTLWSIALVLVLIMPFRWAWQAPPGTTSSTSAAYEQEAYAQQTGYDFLQVAGERYRRDIRLLHDLRRSDPGLRHLDMRTGYYEAGGRSIRLSWEVLQLIRKKNWKR